MAATKRTWLWVVLGVMGTMALIVVVVVVGAVLEFRRHVHNELIDDTAAEREFTTERARFAGQEPLVELAGRDPDGHNDDAIVHRPSRDAPRVEIHHLRALIYDRQHGHLIHADVPGWLLHLMRRGQSRVTSFAGDDDVFAQRRITIEDIERHGPGLVLDGHNRNTQILVWSD